MRHMWKRLVQTALTLVVTASLALAGNVTAQAANGTSGTLIIQPKHGDDKLSESSYNGEFTVYKVAAMDPSVPSLTYVAPFEAYNNNADYTIEKLSDADESARNAVFSSLVKAVREDYNNGLKDSNALTTVASGLKAGGSQTLDYGLYLVVQSKSATGYADVEPFLVFLPDATGYAEDATATAYPKVTPVTTPPETPPDDNPPDDGGDNPPSNPPTTPPTEEGGEETPPAEELPVVDEGGAEEVPTIEEVGGRTGDNSMMTTYGAVAGVAAVALVGWFVWKKRSDKKN